MFRTQAWVAKHTSPSFIVSQYTSTDSHDDISDDIATIVKQDFIEAFTHHRSGAVTESRLFTQEWGFGLDEISLKVRFWHGSPDSMVPMGACRRLSEQVPNSQLITFEEADHLTTLPQSKKYALQIRFRPTTNFPR